MQQHPTEAYYNIMKRFLAAFFALLMLISLLPTSAFAAGVTSTLDMAALNEHSKGAGYEWDNTEFVFEMNGLNLNTKDDYGIKLPGGSTVNLIGDNKITAGRYGIQSFGSITFTGSGTLTITVSDIGVRALTTVDRDNVIFRSGKIVINAATGISTQVGKTSFTGAEMEVNSTINSVYASNIQFAGGKIRLVSPINSKGSVEINATDLTVTADSSAIVADKGININKEKIKVGASGSSLSSADTYNGENAVEFTSTAKFTKKGMLFGGRLPAFVDYIVFTLIIIAVAAVIAVPIIIKKRKTDALIKQSKVYKVSEK